MTAAGPAAAETATGGTGRRHVHEFAVRFADVDMYRHVNNVTFVRYLEDARTAMMFIDPVKRGAAPVGGCVVHRHEVDYLRPLDFRVEPVRILTGVRDITAVTFTLDHELVDDTACYLRASTVLAAYDVEEARPRRLRPDERAYLAGFAAA
ncbi:MAG TPA: thioesterase family protein [Streptosporangiaceae bacterium]|jgi:acyl-CoA thioester hydrolase